MLISSMVFSQQGADSYATVVRGSEDPRAIDEDVFYQHLAHLLVETGPSSCAEDTGTISGISTIGPCIDIAGINPSRLEAFGQEYLEYAQAIDAVPRAELCDADASLMTADSFANHLENAFDLSRQEKVDYFWTRGEEVLGEDELRALLQWGEENIRPDMQQVKMDWAAMMKEYNIPASDIQQMFCRGAPRTIR